MISVVFITANRSSELRSAVLSLIGKIGEPFEIVVIDNNSVDDTREMLLGIAGEHGLDVNYYLNSTNTGVSEARNKGFELAKGDIIYFLDDDAIVTSSGTCISEVAEWMRININFPIVATEIYNVSGKVFQHGAFPSGVKTRKNGEVFNFIGASHFIRKDLTNKLYPSEFSYGGEELYLSYRVKKMGLKIYYTNVVTVDHLPSKSTRLTQSEIKKRLYANAYLVKLYFTPWVYLPLIHLVMLLRVVNIARLNLALYGEFISYIKKFYNKTHVQRLGFGAFTRCLFKYELKKIV